MKSDSTKKESTASKDKFRKSLHLLQPSANDKDILVGAGRMLRSSQRSKDVKSKSDAPEKTKNNSSKGKTSTHKDKSVQTARGDKIKIEVEDLTSTAGPSKNYWEVLAERRRIVLEDALEENKYRTECAEKLEEENRKYKEMLDEAKTLVEVLEEMIGDDRNSINNSLDDSLR